MKSGYILLMAGICALASCTTAPKELDFQAMVQPVPETAVMAEPGYFVWCGTMVKDDKGTYHLFYSRWKKEYGFSSWVTKSEVAHATAPSPFGPFTPKDVALPARGAEYWDGLCTHNPTVHKFGKKYYLYYMGNTGDGVIMTDQLNFVHRNNQRIGVAVADSPDGPWTRFDEPLIDISPDESAPDALMTSNPAIAQRPDGSFLMVYKAVGKKRPAPFGGPVVHLTATSDSPTGPFTKQLKPTFIFEGVDFPAEDPYIWSQDGKMYALVKDMKGNFTHRGKSLALFESPDGMDWTLAPHPYAMGLDLEWESGEIETMTNLERPQLLFEKGKPASLLLATGRYGENGVLCESFNVQVPLKMPKGKSKEFDLGAMLQPVPETACLKDPGYFVWGASMVRDDKGTYHVFYSRWKNEYSFESWVTHSEIAHATSSSPAGPWELKGVALPVRGAEYWDGLCTHNPTIHKFGKKYYLYYMGNTGDGQAHFDENGELLFNWGHRNNQRIGVAVADSPDGPWTRFDKPLVDISPDEDAADALMTSNPAITECPDGSYMLAYKAVAKKRAMPFGGPVITLTAVSDSPTGPFEKLMKPTFTVKGIDFPCEDSFIWCQDGKYYALVSDYHGYFLGTEREFPLFESADGANWTLAAHPFVRGGHDVLWENGSNEYFERLERPQIYFEKGKPAVLLMAVQKKEDNGQLSSCNVQIPLK